MRYHKLIIIQTKRPPNIAGLQLGNYTWISGVLELPPHPLRIIRRGI